MQPTPAAGASSEVKELKGILKKNSRSYSCTADFNFEMLPHNNNMKSESQF